MWFVTVFRVIPSAAAISALVLPRATCRMISNCRGVGRHSRSRRAGMMMGPGS